MKSLLWALLFSLVVFTANAQIIYNSRVTYDAAHPGNYVIDFNNPPPAPPSVPDFTTTTPFGNVTFDAIPSNLDIEFLGNSNIAFLGPNNLALYAFNGQFLADSLLITLPANTFTFGLDLISPSQTVPEPYKLTIYSGANVIGTITSPSVFN